MAQLSDDCFAFGGELMTTAEALARLTDTARAVAEPEARALAKAHGRILARDVLSEHDVPPHDNAAVDGWAVYFDDLKPDQDTSLPWSERIPAGQPLGHAAPRGAALRIFTGAPMPGGEDGAPGPETVLMQEDCREENGVVTIPPGIKRGANRRFAGEDIKRGATILSAGRRLKPQDIGLAASVGRTTLKVYKPLRVAVFSSGDEVFEPGETLPPGGIYDANRLMIIALLEALGCDVNDLGILPDRLDAVEGALDTASKTHDVLITSGGVSTGEEDHIKTAVETLGHLNFWRLAIRPGRPIALGQVGHVPFVGLPGNPVAVMVTFLRFARPLLLRLAGAADIEPRSFQVQADFEYKKKTGRREWLRARLHTLDDGSVKAEKYRHDGAGILSSAVFADGLIELGEDVSAVTPGMTVDFLPFNELMR
ncbi:MAG: molybdopterin molybdotransferase MoeA [Rhodospirillaceae bacterium]|nr:molybdopterin molybdotransferase MoeA [Rhodospirillaceae bacterium]MBT3926903.1 molybdopterin molybdotransferase MoeA [Rhodospirillaceae bacterium]MBT4425791.1 molybdopterin molybdotransferase MoeA [Rhodospirillaceae bacterium]MBT5676956.1 molybdopterin molybdotransferase MoeA [Rhodospirillaceae bacterium]